MQQQKMDAQKDTQSISDFVSQPGATLHDLTSLRTDVQFKVIKLVNAGLMD